MRGFHKHFILTFHMIPLTVISSVFLCLFIYLFIYCLFTVISFFHLLDYSDFGFSAISVGGSGLSLHVFTRHASLQAFHGGCRQAKPVSTGCHSNVHRRKGEQVVCESSFSITQPKTREKKIILTSTGEGLGQTVCS